MKNLDPYTKLKQRLQPYIDKYPLTKEGNIPKFKQLRLLETLLDSHPELIQKHKELRDELIISNGGFGMKYAIKYCKFINDSNVIEDIFQQAQIGLLEAVDRFDPNRKVNFTTFAWHYVRKCIIDFIKKNKLVTAPREMARNIKNVSDVYDILYTKSGGKQVLPIEIQEKLFKMKEIYLKIPMIKDILQLIHLNSSESQVNFVVEITDDIIDENTYNEGCLILKSILLKDLNLMDNDTLNIVKMRFGIDYERPHSISEIKLLKGLTDKEIETYKENTKEYLNVKK